MKKIENLGDDFRPAENNCELSSVDQRIDLLKMHLSLPWKEQNKYWARQELSDLIELHGEPLPTFEPKQLSLFDEIS